MAVTLFMRIPELPMAGYDQLMLGLELDANPPVGLILHVTSEAAGAVNVCEVWQTAQAAETFVDLRLRDAVKAAGVNEPLSYRLEPLHNLFAANIEMIERIGAVSLPAGPARTALAS